MNKNLIGKKSWIAMIFYNNNNNNLEINLTF